MALMDFRTGKSTTQRLSTSMPTFRIGIRLPSGRLIHPTPFVQNHTMYDFPRKIKKKLRFWSASPASPTHQVSLRNLVSLFHLLKAKLGPASISKFPFHMSKLSWKEKSSIHSLSARRRTPSSTSQRPMNRKWLRTSSSARTPGLDIPSKIHLRGAWSITKKETEVIYKARSLEPSANQSLNDFSNNFSHWDFSI